MSFRNGFEGVVAAVVIAASTHAGLIEPIFTNIANHPTARIPGEDGGEFLIIPDTFEMSPGGDRWIFGVIDRDSNSVMMAGIGNVGYVVAREGQMVSNDPTETFRFFNWGVGINDDGVHGFAAKLNGHPSGSDRAVIRSADGVNTIEFIEGDLALGLGDPDDVAGDEIFGDELSSVGILNDGRITFRAGLIGNVGSDFGTALYRDSEVLVQTGISAGVPTPFYGIRHGSITSDRDGNWLATVVMASGKWNVTVNGEIPVPLGSQLDGFDSPVVRVWWGWMGPGGHWFMRGQNADEDEWMLGRDRLIARTGDPVVAGANERWAAVNGRTFSVARANSAGDFVLGGTTDAGRAIVVVNNDAIAIRGGDPVDLDRDGHADDDAFLDKPISDNVFLGRDDYVYMLGVLRNNNGDRIGSGFLRVKIDIPRPGDMNCDGVVTVSDINPFVMALTDPQGYADAFPDCDILNGDCSDDGQVTVSDVNCFVALVTGA